MTKENSRQSSVVGSVHSPALVENGEIHNVQEPKQSGSSATSILSDPMDIDTNNLEPAELAIMPQPESQPMTASNSASSYPSGKDASATVTAASYGTRSRRTATTARPNYAEDKELEMEYEHVPARNPSARKPTKGGAESVAATAPAQSVEYAQDAIPAHVGAQFGDTMISMPSHYKDPIPGTSTFSSKPPKKRKAAGQNQGQTQPLPQPMSIPTQIYQTYPPALIPSNYYYPPSPQMTRGPPPQMTRGQDAAMTLIHGIRESNMLSFDNCDSRLKYKRLISDCGAVLEVNDHVYMICEPPGEPYYMGRIMEFIHVNNDPNDRIESLRMNWYYRPKDIGRKVNDTRQVFASMHSDISPLTAIRGKCQIKHKSELGKGEDVQKTHDCFWYEKLYDRYIHRYYDVIPSKSVINVPANVKKALDAQWKFIVVEPLRGKELTSAVKTCKKCSQYCASNDSVDCAVCKNTYHMMCVSPPLEKKPSRGFAWACGPCSKAQERKLEARLDPSLSGVVDAEDDDFNDDGDSPLSLERPPDAALGDIQANKNAASTAKPLQPSTWLFRYLGIHCKLEDVLDSDDRIYPRASSRIGSRHQAIVTPWYGNPVEYVEPVEVKKKTVKSASGKKTSSLTKDTIQALELEKQAKETRPKWIMAKPHGYVHRGEDLDQTDPNNTAKLMFKPPGAPPTAERGMDNIEYTVPYVSAREKLVDDYLAVAKSKASEIGLPDRSTNLIDIALDLLRAYNYDPVPALHAVTRIDKQAFKEPELSPLELKKFEEGVAKFGSEWHSIKKHVKTVSAANIVRFYYTWKKTERGRQVWGKYHGRKGKREQKRNETSAGKLQDDVAHDQDDSAFDNNKAFQKKRRFHCKFCQTQHSRQWRRAPNTPAGATVSEFPSGKSGKEKGDKLIVALCRRCAELWRRYGIQWEDVEEVTKKLAQANGGRQSRRKIDDGLIKELHASDELLYALNGYPIVPAPPGYMAVPMMPLPQPGSEPPKKKAKSGAGVHTAFLPEMGDGVEFKNLPVPVPQPPPPQKKKVEKPPPPPPPPPEPPKARILPCAICDQLESMGDELVACRECRMSVHRSCYGVIGENRSPSKWVCDTCINDKSPAVSLYYECMLCPIKETKHEFVEPPKSTHKKRTEKDKERERIEREKAQRNADYFQQRQHDLHRPANPREPLKRTSENNWVHVTCAVFTPEVKFGNATALKPCEGISSIPISRHDDICKVCKQKGVGPCVSCRTCHTPIHVECARQAGYFIGFDITPVKSSRKDHTTVVTINGETGTMVASIWCKDHGPPTKSAAHQLQDHVEGTDLNALQLYVQTYKQADLALTGTVRKANLISQSKASRNAGPAPPSANRRISTVNTSSSRGNATQVKAEEAAKEMHAVKSNEPENICITCNTDITPRWYPYDPAVEEEVSAVPEPLPTTNGDSHPDESPEVNGTATTQNAAEIAASQVAIATAALHEKSQPNVPEVPPLMTDWQCHKCWKRNKKVRGPSPPPKSPPPVPSPVPLEASPDVATLDTIMVPPMPQFGWSQPYATPYTLSQSPTVRSQPIHHVNGLRSPHLTNGTPQPFNTSPMRQQLPPQSPRLNGHPLQPPSGFPLQRRESGSSNVHIQNGPYSQYGSHSSPQHLANGNSPLHPAEQQYTSQMSNDSRYSPSYPPPSVPSGPSGPSGHLNSNENFIRETDVGGRKNESDGPFMNRQLSGGSRSHETEQPVQQKQQLPSEQSRYSPPILVDPALFTSPPPPLQEHQRNISNAQSNGLMNGQLNTVNGNGPQNPDRRVDGGASASPSLRNLLS
ncbi:hypothetical protein BJ878DRAFT_331997 [Calycina marina]|uniref:Uncharacterized protein n=1 Tax=Calycina marina TaxID=1763456 RepID=A0A9P8CGK9_9HELO|nr:hypothetical protein BJ878DRAFT_331997 [Calycina marina]